MPALQPPLPLLPISQRALLVHRVRPPPSLSRCVSDSSPSASSVNAAGQWFFCGELAGRPGLNVPALLPIRSTPCSPAAFSNCPTLVRSRSAACGQARSPLQPMRRVSLALRPLPKRSLPPSFSTAEAGAQERLLVMRSVPAELPLRRCRSEQALLAHAEPEATSWAESMFSHPDSIGRASDASPSRGQVAAARPPEGKRIVEASQKKIPSAFKKRQGRHVNEVRFLERTRGMRHSRRAQLSCSGGIHRWSDDSCDTGRHIESLPIAAGDVVGCDVDAKEAELSRLLSGMCQRFSALDDPGTPRLLESELLVEQPLFSSGLLENELLGALVL